MTARALLAAAWCSALLVLLPGCKQPLRVGEHVMVEWEKDQPPYPAYIIARVGSTRYRVHFDGYDSRWDEDVSVDRILGKVEGPVVAPPPPPKVALAAGVASPRASGSAGEVAVSPYREGDRVRVTWRGSVYSATVTKVVAKDRFEVHYEGHEAAWDEVLGIDRIVGRR
jgi:RNA binding activity-knot of a chromodomain